jgi:RimJ/RimL family protein N-acetyltransferase
MPDAQRKGYATEAASAARPWVYEVCSWPLAVSYIMPENTASAGVAEKLGALKDGTTVSGGILLDVWRHPPATEVLQ